MVVIRRSSYGRIPSPSRSASAVVIVGLEHPGPDGPVEYSIAEYKNIVGRAGRLGYGERGASYLVATSLHEEHYYWQNYVSAAPEDLVSRFLDADPRTLIIRVLVASGRTGVTGDEIIDFLECSFAVFQMRAAGTGTGWDRHALERALSDLLQHGMIEQRDDAAIVPGGIDSTCFPMRRLNIFTKCVIRAGMSSRRSLSAGSMMGKTFRR
jgi:replicative superfamily II helicase